MGIANRIINILVLIAAIAAIVLGFMLFNKREDVAKSREMMAKHIVDNSKALNPAAKIKETDMAIKVESKKLTAPLSTFDNTIKSTVKQRKEMAQNIVALSEVVGQEMLLGEYDAAKLADFNEAKRAEEYETISKDVAARVKTYVDIRAAYGNAVKDLAEKCDRAGVKYESASYTLDQAGIDYAGKQINTLAESTRSFYKRSDDFSQAIKGFANLFPADANVSMPTLDSADEYPNELSAMKTQIEKYVEQYQETVREKNRLTDENKVLAEKNESMQKEIEVAAAEKVKREAEIASLKKEVTRLEKILKPVEDAAAEAGQTEVATAAAVPAEDAALLHVKGKVLYVDAENGFLLVDLGKTVKVDMKDSNGKAYQKTVPMPKDALMTVTAGLTADQAKFKGKIQVVSYRADEPVAVANILPSPVKVAPSVGDYVLFTTADLDNMRAARQEKARVAREKAIAANAKKIAQTEAVSDAEAEALLGIESKDSEAKEEAPAAKKDDAAAETKADAAAEEEL